MATSQETLQKVAHQRYNLDLPGAMKRAWENQTASTTKITGVNGLTGLMLNTANPGAFPTAKPRELYKHRDSIQLLLALWPAP